MLSGNFCLVYRLRIQLEGDHVAHDVGNSFKSREATWSYKGIKMDLKLLAEAWALVVAADPVAELSAAVLHAGLRAEAEIPLSPNPQSINSTPKPCNTEPTPKCKIPIRVLGFVMLHSIGPAKTA